MIEDIPCRYCGRYYGHKSSCASFILNSGVADKLMFKEFEQRYKKAVCEAERELTSAQAEIARLREALEFYASPSSWQHTGGASGGGNQVKHKILSTDCEPLPLSSVGGKRAREALNKGSV